VGQVGKIRVFVSSSLTELESEREIAQKTIAQLSLEPVMFETIHAMDQPLDVAYLNEIRNSHIFVLILWKDLTEPVEREFRTAIEGGLSILIFVKIPTHREARTPRLQALIDAAVERSTIAQVVPFRKNFRSLSQLENELRDSLMKLISDRYTEPVLSTTNVVTICEINQTMIKNSRRRVLQVSKTPMLLLGIKPYDSGHKNLVSSGIHQSLLSWIDSIKLDENKKMLYLYSIEDTYREMKENKLEQTVRANLVKFKTVEEETNGRFQLRSIQEFPGRILVCDDSFGICFRSPKDKVFYIHRQDAAISNHLFEIFSGFNRSTEGSLTKLKSQLKLK
jgi:vacuolar-type H+-ATPase subunit F/Vma7